MLAEFAKRAAASGRVLVMLDNVLDGNLLTIAEIKQLPSARWLQLLITAQLGPLEFPDIEDKNCIELDEMTEGDALALIQRYQPDGAFTSEHSREAACGIVRLLGNFSLAGSGAWRERGRTACRVRFL